MSDAQTTLYNIVERALQSREPVLIPTFAVGRAQLLMLLFADRLHTLPSRLRDRVRLVVDGMAQEATTVYHEFAADRTYMAEAMANRVENGMETPFLPDDTMFPESDADRQAILDEAGHTDGKIPVIVAPSGMLTGGNSPRYLTEFAARFGSARVLLTGYQAKNTTGRVLQDQIKAGKDELTYETEVSPIGTDWPAVENVMWTTVETDGASERVTRATLPAEWVKTVEGLSGHTAQSGLLKFARTVGPETIALIHGPNYAQEHLAKHLTENVAGVKQVTRSRLLTPIAVTREIEVETPALSPEQFESEEETYGDQLEHLHELMVALNEEVAAARNDTGLSEATIREIVRDELQHAEAHRDGGF